MRRLSSLFLLVVSLLLELSGPLSAQTDGGAGRAWWGKWNSAMPLEPVAMLAAGSNACAMRLLVSEASRLRGCTVFGLRFYIGDKTVVSSAKVWLSSKLTGTPDIVEVDVPLDQLLDYTHDQQPTAVLFDQPVVILPPSLQNPYASVYAGYTVTLTNGTTCAMMAAGSQAAETAYSNYYNGSNISGDYGPLALQLLVGGGSLKAYDVQPLSFGEHLVVAGHSTFSLPATIVNWGIEPVGDLTFALSDGLSTTRLPVTLATPINELGLRHAIDLSVPLPASGSQHDYQLTVETVDGQSNGYDDAAADGRLIVLRQAGAKRVVMEEFTGTWCPNCVRGITGISLLEQQYADRFIALAVHSGDPMAVGDYVTSNIKRRAGGALPACSIDRRYDCDPYLGDNLYQGHFTTDAIVADALTKLAPADISVVARLSGDSRQAHVDVSTTFWYDAVDSPYRLVLVLGGDSLTGTGSDWLQVNGLYQKSGYDADLDFYTSGPRYIDMAYDHVPVAVAGVNDGLPQSIAHPLVCGETQHYLYDFELSDNTLVQDTRRLFVVALLADTRTGYIVNAAKGRVQPSDAEGVASPTADRPSAAIYDLQGRRLTLPSLSRKGLYIRDGHKHVVR